MPWMRSRFSLVALLATFASLLFGISPAQATSSPSTAPLNVQQSSSLNTITVSWQTPALTNGTISNYLAQVSSDTGFATPISATVASNVYSTTFSGLTPNTNYYVRVEANNGVAGTWGYPWKKLYSFYADNGSNSANYYLSGTTVVANSSQTWNYVSGYGLAALGGQAANTYANANFGRVRYAETATINGTQTIASQDMKTWTASTVPNWTGGSNGASDASTISYLAIPDLANNPNVFQTNVSDFNSYDSNAPARDEASTTGRLEIWPYNYDVGTSGLSGGTGSATSFDYDDVDAYASDYGSFQIHSLTNSGGITPHTDFAWNRHFSGSGGFAEIGFGDDPNGTTNNTEGYDWTFCSLHSDCVLPSSFQLDIMIDIPITTGPSGTLSLNSSPSIGSTYQFGKIASIVAAVPNTPGTTTFYYSINGAPKQIYHCVNLPSSGSSVTCNWKVSAHGPITITAIFTATSGGSVSNTLFIPITVARTAARG